MNITIILKNIINKIFSLMNKEVYPINKLNYLMNIIYF
jgi:hypothetical protein